MCLHWENEAGTHIFDSQDWFKMWLVNSCLQDQLQAFIWPFSFHKPVYIWHHPVHSQVFSSWTGQKWCNRLSKPFKQEKTDRICISSPLVCAYLAGIYLGFLHSKKQRKHSNCVLILTDKQHARWVGVCYSWLGVHREQENWQCCSFCSFSVASSFFPPSLIDAAQGLISTGSY